MEKYGETAGKTTNVIAIDLGASSGRLILVSLQDGLVSLEEIYRFANEGILAGERFYTDILHIYHELIRGLRVFQQRHIPLDSFAIDAWGVDFGVIDREGELICNPYHYRDRQGAGMVERAEEIFGKKGLFKATGVQDMWYNTVYQIMGIRQRKADAFPEGSTFLMIADLLAYFFTGKKGLEYTAVSTTQMYDLNSQCWSAKVLEELGLFPEMFPRVMLTGEVRGMVLPELCEKIGFSSDAVIPVIAAAQHDSASAAFAVPAEEEDYIFINSGTWSILGTILEHPILDEEIFDRNLSNEGAVGGKIKLVKTIMGMWLIQELRKQWEKDGKSIDYGYLLEQAARAEGFAHFVDVDDELFVAPANMEKAVDEYCRGSGQTVPQGQGEYYRCVMESLAFEYKEAVADFEKITGKTMKTIYLLGGAVQDQAFCQYIANAAGKQVSAGPVEATAIGNAMVQLIAIGAVEDEAQAAQIIRRSFHTRIYQPRDREEWEAGYQKYLKIRSGAR